MPFAARQSETPPMHDGAEMTMIKRQRRVD
jgi:hypothetical protein